MERYTKEFKIEVIKYYKEKGVGYERTAQYYNIPSLTTVKRWVKKYELHGERGLTKNTEKYDGKYKLNVITYMYENKLSLAETVIYFNLGERVVSQWERIYREKGLAGLEEENRGRNKTMRSGKYKKSKRGKQSEKSLLEEVERLRMEVAYLKKLNALVRERQEFEKKIK